MTKEIFQSPVSEADSDLEINEARLDYLPTEAGGDKSDVVAAKVE